MPAVFPAVRTLIAPPKNFYSLNQPALLVSGGAKDLTNYPLSALTDGSGGLGAFRFISGNGSVLINLNSGNTLTPNIFAVFGHNFDPGMIVNVQANVVPDMTSPLLNRGFSVRQPSCWIDLRGFPVMCDFWQLNFANNSKNVTIGEIAVGLGIQFEGIINPQFSEELSSQQDRMEIEYGKMIISAAGTIGRKMQLTLQMPSTDRANFESIYADAGINGTRVLVVPDSRKNDIWLTDWPAFKSIIYQESTLVARATLVLYEEAFGAY